MKAAAEKFQRKYVETVKKIESDFSDMRAGQNMLISSPKSIANFIEGIPFGTVSSVKEMRLDLAKAKKADNTCPLTTGIFLRIAIEASLEESNELKPKLPFWRLLDSNSPILQKLPLPKNYAEKMRETERMEE